MFASLSRRLRRALAPASIMVLAAAAAAAQTVSPESRPSAAAEEPDRGLVASIQERLGALGYDAGPADGILGQKTRDAIRQYEAQSGLPETGEPSPALLRRLAGGSAALPGGPGAQLQPPAARIRATAQQDPGVAVETPPAAAEATRTAEQPPATAARGTVADTSWQFRDEDGAVFTLRLNPDGTVAGVPYADALRWNQSGDDFELRYENRLGETTLREGQLVSAREMAGIARSSRGREWRWSATRIP